MKRLLKENQFEIADVFHLYGEQYRQKFKLSREQKKVMRNIQTCRTAALGGHVEQCNECGFEKISYNSGRDRHCPKCQTMTKERWLNDRKAELLPCSYFHLVFTLPHTLNPIILANKKRGLSILFAVVSETPCRPLAKIRSGGSMDKLALLLFCTLGARHCWTIFISIALSLAELSPPRKTDGLRPGNPFFSE